MAKYLVLLDILIPTFNREGALHKNLSLLADFIQELKLQRDVQIIISDNASDDNTTGFINSFIESHSINITLFTQVRNIGLEKNAVFVLSKSESKYVMYLGDDDYLQFEYFEKVVETLKNNNFSCIIPSFIAKTIDNKVTGYRNLGGNKIYKKGFDAAYNLSLLGHQLSGVVLLRDGTLEHYLSHNNLSNIYLFVAFVGYNCLRGNALHLTEYPVSVTVGEKKDWNYGNDALFNEIIKNVPLIYSSGINRFKLENKFFISNVYSIFFIYSDLKDRLYALYLSSISKNLTSCFKAYIPFLLLLFGLNKTLSIFFKRIGVDR